MSAVDVLAVLRRYAKAERERLGTTDNDTQAALTAVAELIEALQEIAECTTPGDGVPNTDWVHERARTTLARVGGAA